MLATGARIQGRPTLLQSGGEALPLTSATPIHVNDVIETDNASRAVAADGRRQLAAD